MKKVELFTLLKCLKCCREFAEMCRILLNFAVFSKVYWSFRIFNKQDMNAIEVLRAPIVQTVRLNMFLGLLWDVHFTGYVLSVLLSF